MTTPARPDLAAMQHTLPTRDGPTPVDVQAAAQRAVEQPHIDYAGHRFHFTRQLDMFDLAELGDAVDRAEHEPMAAIGAVNRCLREWLPEYSLLRQLFRERNTQGVTEQAMQEYMKLASDVFVAVAARPTEAPAGSSDGREQTSTSSKGEPPNGTPPSGNTDWTPPESTPGS